MEVTEPELKTDYLRLSEEEGRREEMRAKSKKKTREGGSKQAKQNVPPQEQRTNKRNFVKDIHEPCTVSSHIVSYCMSFMPEIEAQRTERVHKNHK